MFNIIWGVFLFIIGVMVSFKYSSRFVLEVEETNAYYLKSLKNIGLKYLFDKQEIDIPVLVYEIQIINRGNREIITSENDIDLVLSPPNDFIILKMLDIIKKHENVGDISHGETTIRYKLKSIKKNEYIKLKVLVAYEGKDKLILDFENLDELTPPSFMISSGRFQNVEKIEYYSKPPEKRIRILTLAIFGLLGLGFYFCSVFWATFDQYFVKRMPSFMDSFYGIIGSVIILCIPLLVKWVLIKTYNH